MAYNPQSHKGEKMYVRGLLIKLPGEQRMTISSIETVVAKLQQLMKATRIAGVRPRALRRRGGAVNGFA